MSATIVWFRDDLRVDDNPALASAAADGRRRRLSSTCWRRRRRTAHRRRGEPMVAASRSRRARHASARARRPVSSCGAARPERSCRRWRARRRPGASCWNRRYASAERRVDAEVEAALQSASVAVDTFGGNLLFEPSCRAIQIGRPDARLHAVLEGGAGHRRAAQADARPRGLAGGAASARATPWPRGRCGRPSPTGRRKWQRRGRPAATGRGTRCTAFSTGGRAAMPRIATGPTSRRRRGSRRICISARSRPPDLARGAACRGGAAMRGRDANKFLAELGWREFAYHLLFQFEADLAEPISSGASMPFRGAVMTTACTAWQRGRTGYPIVDAGMRQLWTTGWMHNRVRMIAASFLIKHLLIDWRDGRSLVLGHAGRCRSGQQCGELAMGGRLGRRCGALFPHLQSDPAGREVRPATAPMCAVRCRSSPACPTPGSMRRRTRRRTCLREAGVRLGETYPAPDRRPCRGAPARARCLSNRSRPTA